jgi:hypothetical protein
MLFSSPPRSSADGGASVMASSDDQKYTAFVLDDSLSPPAFGDGTLLVAFPSAREAMVFATSLRKRLAAVQWSRAVLALFPSSISPEGKSCVCAQFQCL